MLGTLLGNYRIVEHLGQGGMGVVYVGRHESLGNRVAVKVLRAEMSRNAEMVRRFFNEAQAAAAIRNPGIVQVFDFGATAHGSAYFVMELLDGVSLSTRLRQRRLDAAESCRIARQTANVLQSAHEAVITHRDLKPDNLFLVPDSEVIGGERVKVLDFGIAKLAGELLAAGVQTRADLVMGTPSYMSPEHCRGAGTVDTRADIYSLGCILFKMVCGRAPFIGEGPGDIIGAHLHMAPPDLLQLAPDAPPELAELVAKMLAKRPEARPQTMTAVSQALEEILRALGRSSGRPSLPPPMGSGPMPRRDPMATPVASLATTLPVPAPPAAHRRDSMPLPPLAPLPPQPAPLSITSTTLGGSAGVSSIQPSGLARRLPLVFGGVVVLVAIAAISIVLASGDSSRPERQTGYGDIPAAPPASGTDTGATLTVAAPPTGDTASLAADAAAALPPEDDPLATECRGHEENQRWRELEQCADRLKSRNPELAEKLAARAVEGKANAARIATFEAAMREKNLKRAKAELDKLGAESPELARLKDRYAAAEAQAIAALATELGKVKHLHCQAYEELLIKERAAKPPRVVAEAARRVPCTKCDADALAQQAQDELAKRRYAASLDAYDAALRCRPSSALARQAIEVACDNHSLAKAKLFWGFLPAGSRAETEAKQACRRNGITEAQLKAP